MPNPAEESPIALPESLPFIRRAGNVARSVFEAFLGRRRFDEVTAADPYPLPWDGPTAADSRDWMLLSSGTSLIKDGYKNVEEEVRIRLRLKARRMAQFNPHAKACIKNTIKYVLGRGVEPKWGTDDAINDSLRAVWDDFTHAAQWTRRSHEMLRRIIRDGELFIRRFEMKLNASSFMGAPKAGEKVQAKGKAPATRTVMVPRFIDPELIRDPETQKEEDGIVTDPEDVETIQAFKKVKASDAKQLDEQIPADEIICYRAECDLNEKRGVSPIASVIPYIEMYDGWLMDRVILSRIRGSVALVRTINGNASQIKTMLSNEQGQEMTQRPLRGEHKPIPNLDVKQRRFRPGTVINAREGIDYKFIAPNLQAQDVHYDGRAILLAIAAGAGLAEFMVSGDASNANYASVLVSEGPAVKEFQDWQEIMGEIFTMIWCWIIETTRENGNPHNVPDDYDPRTVDWAFPDMVARNRILDVQANVAMHGAGAMSKRTMMERDGLDPDIEEERIEAEAEEDAARLAGMPDPFPEPGEDGKDKPAAPGDGEDGQDGAGGEDDNKSGNAFSKSGAGGDPGFVPQGVPGVS